MEIRQVFFSAGASDVKTNPGPNYPFVWADGEERQNSPNNFLRRTYLGTKYEWLFRSFSVRVHTHEPAWEKTCKYWNATMPKTETAAGIVRTATISYNWLIQCAEESENDVVHMYIMHAIDAHTPLICAIEDSGGDITDADAIAMAEKYNPDPNNAPHEGSIPDVVGDVIKCTFWNETKTKMDACVHLMCKALPQRCQIRNLREIISNYCQQNDRVYDFMYQTLINSLLGSYKHSKKRLDWKSRKYILRRLVYKPPTRSQMQEWIFSSFQNLLFYIIKEHLIYAMRMIPSLHDVVMVTYKWKNFEESVVDYMDKMRGIVEKNIEEKMANLTLAETLNGVEDLLAMASKSQLPNLFRAQRQSFAQAVVSTCDRQDEQAGEVNFFKEFPREYRSLMREMTKRERKMETMIMWLRFFSVRPKSIEILLNSYKHYSQNAIRNDLRKMLKTAPRYEFEAIRALFDSIHQTHREIRVFTLPKHYIDMQLKAVRKRFALEDDDDMPKYVGETLACMNCKTFKAFVARTEKQNVRQASGHCKVIVDDVTLECFCGRKKNTHANKRRKNDASNMDARVQKRIWKNKRKLVEAEDCANFKCMRMNLIGKLLQFHNELFLLCPKCALPAVYKPNGHRETWSCVMCIQNENTGESKMQCMVCDKETCKWDTIETADDGNEKVVICETCLQPWVKEDSTSYTLQYLRDKVRAERNI